MVSSLGQVLDHQEMRHSPRSFSAERSKGKEDQVADDIHGSATSDAATLVSVQKRARFALCAKHMHTYTYTLSVWYYKKTPSLLTRLAPSGSRDMRRHLRD